MILMASRKQPQQLHPLTRQKRSSNGQRSDLLFVHKIVHVLLTVRMMSIMCLLLPQDTLDCPNHKTNRIIRAALLGTATFWPSADMFPLLMTGNLTNYQSVSILVTLNVQRFHERDR